MDEFIELLTPYNKELYFFQEGMFYYNEDDEIDESFTNEYIHNIILVNEKINIMKTEIENELHIKYPNYYVTVCFRWNRYYDDKRKVFRRYFRKQLRISSLEPNRYENIYQIDYENDKYT